MRRILVLQKNILKMRFKTGFLFAIALLIGIDSCISVSIEEAPGNIIMSNFPYSQPMDSDLQPGRIIVIPQRNCHPKRNSELINSLLGLPKNMNNAGK